jgi:subtilase family serine protease
VAATENTLFVKAAGPEGPRVIEDYETFYERARQEHVTVLANAGDYGTQNASASQGFPIPDYQELWLSWQKRSSLGDHRGIPDVSYNADDYNSPILVYTSFLGVALGPAYVGYYFIGGTSEGSPQWAGIVADLNQYAHAPLGFLNSILYVLGGLGQFPEFGHDITIGNNSYGGVSGYSATVGWDLASGWALPSPGRAIARLGLHVYLTPHPR